MDSDEIWRHIDSQRAAVADILSGLSEDQWARPSLCDGWTVRDVAAHLTFAHARLREVLLPGLRAGFRGNVMIRDVALRNPLSHAEIVATLRSFIGSRRRAPFVSEKEPLLDVLVHTQDICLPLGIAHEPPADAATASIDRLIQLNRGPFRLRPPLREVRLVATDVEWRHGDGKVVEGPIKWLLLAVAGREVAHAHLDGAVAALA